MPLALDQTWPQKRKTPDMAAQMRHHCQIAVGPAIFRIGSDWQQPIAQLQSLYRDYPNVSGQVPDFTVRLEAQRWWRRFVRPSVSIAGDYMLPDASPLPLAQGLLAAEMAMNLQMAMGWRRHLLLHASAAERDGRVLVMTGLSGSGKSTLSAILAENGWRFLADEFVLLEPESGEIHPFPRPVSLKNSGIAAMETALARADHGRFGPLLKDTPKGDIRHLIPPRSAIDAMRESAPPALLLYPGFGKAKQVRPVALTENFLRLTQASTNYVTLAEAGFQALTRFVQTVPAFAIDYANADEAMALIGDLWPDAAQ